MRRNVFISIIFGLLCGPVFAQGIGAVGGFCNRGATNALTSGLASSNTLQGIAPSCTVTVYYSGTATPVPGSQIYSDANKTVLGNPFTANIDGSWLFFASVTSLYDVTLSGGTAPNNYATPRTVTGLMASFTPVAGTTILPAGVPITTAIVAAACPGSSQGVLILPAGIVPLASMVSLPSNCRILGQGSGQTTVAASNASAIAAAFDGNGITGSQLSDFSLACAQSPATCTVGIRIRYSTSIGLARLNISGGGYGAVANPRAQIYTEDVDNIGADHITLSNSGGVYEWVNGYGGLPSTRISLTNLVDNNVSAADAITWFDCQKCKVGDSYVNEGNVSGVSPTTQDGYAYLLYATNTTYALTSGCTGSGTITCTIPLTGGGNTQLPVGPAFRVLISGVTGGTGTLNGTFDASLASSTTFTVSGVGNTSGASYGSAFIFYPTTGNLWTHVQADNCAGTCFYMQGADYSTLTGWVANNCAQQETGAVLPTGCVAVNGGNPTVIGNPAHGDAVGPGTANGSGQYCLDLANTVDFSAHGFTCNNAGIAGVRLFGGSYNNVNFDIGDITIDNVPTCVKSNSASTNSGVIGPGVCQNFTTTGLQPSSGGISFRNWKLDTTSYIPCIDDFFPKNVWSEITCGGGFDLFAGSNTKGSNLRIGNVTAGSQNHAIEFIGAQHVVLNEPIIDGANDGIFFTNSGGTQSSDITLLHPTLKNITSQPAIWDQAPSSITAGVTSTLNTISYTGGATIAAGMGVADYNGSGFIPNGAVITNVSGTCSGGCTITFSGTAATGTNASDTVSLQASMPTGIKIFDPDIQGNLSSCPTVSQTFLIYGFQGADIERTNIGCFGGQGVMDFRGQSGQAIANVVNGGVITGGSGSLAAIYLPGGNVGSSGNLNVSNLTATGSLTNAFYDHSTATGNVFNNFTNVIGANTMSITNTGTKVTGTTTVSLTPAGATVSTCTEQTFTISGLFLQTSQPVTVTPPSNMGTHLWVGSARVSSTNTLAIAFCADSTGGTPPSGNWKVIAN